MYFDNFFVILSKTCDKIKLCWQWLTWVLHGFPYIASLSLNNHHTVRVKVCLLLHSMQIQDLAQSINISQSTKKYFVQNWTKIRQKVMERKKKRKCWVSHQEYMFDSQFWFPIFFQCIHTNFTIIGHIWVKYFC